MEALVLDKKYFIRSQLPIIDFSPSSHLYSEGCRDDWRCASSARKSRVPRSTRQHDSASEHEGLPADKREAVASAKRVCGTGRMVARASDSTVAETALARVRSLAPASEMAHQRAVGRAPCQSVCRASDEHHWRRDCALQFKGRHRVVSPLPRWSWIAAMTQPIVGGDPVPFFAHFAQF